MNSAWFGDSYDIVKRFFADILKRNGYSVTVDPMFTGTWQQIEEPFHRFIGAERLSDAEWPSSRSRTALLLDPDTGVGAKATRQHVTLERIVDELERYEIVFSFDQSFSRGQSAEEKMSEKLNGLRKKGAYGFYYNSHAKFLFATRQPDELVLIKEAFVATGLPETRFWNQTGTHAAPNESTQR